MCRVDIHIDRRLRLPCQSSRFRRPELGFQGLDNLAEIVGVATNFVAACRAGDILGASLKRRFEHGIGIGGVGPVDNLADPVEHKRDAVGLAEIAAEFRKRRAHFRRRPVAVVGQGIDDQRDTGRAVALIANLFVDRAIVAAGRFVDRPIDAVLRHVGATRRRYRRA